MDVDVKLEPSQWKERVQVLRKEGKIIEVSHRRKDGTTFPVEINVSYYPLDVHNGFIIGIARNITERNKANEELKRLHELLIHQATSDPLTGISNRIKFNEVLGMEIARSKRFKLPLSLIMMDIAISRKLTTPMDILPVTMFCGNSLQECQSPLERMISSRDGVVKSL
jgi:hypothetical protein